MAELETEFKYQHRSARGPSNEALTVKLRYKAPTKRRSTEFAQAVDYRPAEPSTNFRFTMAVCKLGSLLQESNFKAKAEFERAIANAQSSLGKDRDGQRSEFVFLAKTARKLATSSARR